MGIFEELSMDVSHLKAGVYGETGVGKTTTAVLMAIGLHRHIKSNKPVAMLDTERGSGFTADLFNRGKVKVVVARSRSFKDLLSALREAQQISDIFVVDSISHPWRDLMKSYKRAKNREFISLRDWGFLKEAWHDGWSIGYVNTPLHIVMCGRSANVFEDVEEERGDKTTTKSIKVGTKMSTEGETGYEPNLLIEMRRMLTMDGGVYSHEAAVLKDRSFQLDGLTAEWRMPRDQRGNPQLDRLIEENKPFTFILPHIQTLNLGQTAAGIRATDSSDMFPDGGTAREKAKARRLVELAEILAMYDKYWPGQSAANKKARGDVTEGIATAMGAPCRSWDSIKEDWTNEQVHQLYHTMVGLTKKALHPLEKSLGKGPDEQAAVDAVAALAKDYWEGRFEAKVTEDLPI